jgi:hypothetical protein
MKVLFLDWDGVGNNRKTRVKPYGDSYVFADPYCTFLINRIVDRTKCEVVLSSAWRHSKTWRQDMKAQGLIFKFLDRTGNKHSDVNRGDEIRDWLDKHPEVEKYAILDDYNDMLEEQQENFFQTQTSIGITDEIADAVEEHLK